jgi:hypothetical protein
MEVESFQVTREKEKSTKEKDRVKLRFAVKALYYEWSQKTCSTAILNGFNF